MKYRTEETSTSEEKWERYLGTEQPGGQDRQVEELPLLAARHMVLHHRGAGVDILFRLASTPPALR